MAENHNSLGIYVKIYVILYIHISILPTLMSVENTTVQADSTLKYIQYIIPYRNGRHVYSDVTDVVYRCTWFHFTLLQFAVPCVSMRAKILHALLVALGAHIVLILHLWPALEVVHHAEDEDGSCRREYGDNGEDCGASAAAVLVSFRLDVKVVYVELPGGEVGLFAEGGLVVRAGATRRGYHHLQTVCGAPRCSVLTAGLFSLLIFK